MIIKVVIVVDHKIDRIVDVEVFNFDAAVSWCDGAMWSALYFGEEIGCYCKYNDALWPPELIR